MRSMQWLNLWLFLIVAGVFGAGALGFFFGSSQKSPVRLDFLGSTFPLSGVGDNREVQMYQTPGGPRVYFSSASGAQSPELDWVFFLNWDESLGAYNQGALEMIASSVSAEIGFQHLQSELQSLGMSLKWEVSPLGALAYRLFLPKDFKSKGENFGRQTLSRPLEELGELLENVRNKTLSVPQDATLGINQIGSPDALVSRILGRDSSAVSPSLLKVYQNHLLDIPSSALLVQGASANIQSLTQALPLSWMQNTKPRRTPQPPLENASVKPEIVLADAVNGSSYLDLLFPASLPLDYVPLMSLMSRLNSKEPQALLGELLSNDWINDARLRLILDGKGHPTFWMRFELTPAGNTHSPLIVGLWYLWIERALELQSGQSPSASGDLFSWFLHRPYLAASGSTGADPLLSLKDAGHVRIIHQDRAEGSPFYGSWSFMQALPTPPISSASTAQEVKTFEFSPEKLNYWKDLTKKELQDNHFQLP